MFRFTTFLLMGIVVVSVAHPSSPPELPPPAVKKIDFQSDIAPVIEEHCIRCHGPKKQKSLYRMDSREDVIGSGSERSAISPGNSAESFVVKLISGIDPGYMRMPPKGDPLSAEEIGLIRAWIDQGVPWDDALEDGEIAIPHAPGEWHVASTAPKSLTPDWIFTDASGADAAIWADHAGSAGGEEGDGMLLWNQDAGFYQGRVSTTFQALVQGQDVSGGLIWQVSNQHNYVMVELNTQRQSLCLIHVEGGVRRELARSEVPVPEGDWLELEVSRMGDHVDVRLNGERRLSADIGATGGAGGVGLWKPAASATRFSLPVISRQ